MKEANITNIDNSENESKGLESYDSRTQEARKLVSKLMKGDAKRDFFVNESVANFNDKLAVEFGADNLQKYRLFHVLAVSSAGFDENGQELNFKQLKEAGIIENFDFPGEYSVEEFLLDLENKLKERELGDNLMSGAE